MLSGTPAAAFGEQFAIADSHRAELAGPVLRVDTNSYDHSAILVRFRDDAELPRARDILPGTSFTQSFELFPGLQQVQLGRDMTVATALAAYEENPLVAYAEPDYQVRFTAATNDPSFGSLWGMTQINALDAWNVTTGDASTVVAVIDTGVDYNHPDLADNIWVNSAELRGKPGVDDDRNGFIDDVHGWDFANDDSDPMDDVGHGTHVAGTIGAVGNNGVGVAGVNWDVQIMPLKFLGADGSGSTSDAIAALNYAVANGATISNNSWGGGGFSLGLLNAIRAARSEGHIFVTSAGNDASNNDTSPQYPANYDLDNIISVAASDSSDRLARFSNYGPTTVDIAAPGVGILSTVPDNNYQYYSGTSMATPHVAGVVALVRSQNPQASYREAIQQVFDSAEPLASLQGKVATGGRLDAGRAINSGSTANVNPPLTVTLSSGAARIGETRSTNIAAVLSGVSTQPVTVNLGFSGTAQYSADYIPSAQQIVIPAGSQRRSITLTARQDALVEGNEEVIVDISNVSNAIENGVQRQIVTIDDNDTAKLVIELAKTVAELGGGRAISVKLFTASGTGGTARLAPGITLSANVVDTRQGTAKGGADYSTFGTQTITFRPGSGNNARQSVNLTPRNDALVEGNETVKLRLQQLSTTLNGQAKFGNTSNTITIDDDDTARLVIQARSTLREEGAAQPILVTLRTSNGSGGTARLAPGVTLSARVVDLKSGTAEVGKDYRSFGTQSVSFGPGSGNGTQRSAILTPKNDALVEGYETIKLRLQQLNKTLSGQASLGNTGNRTTINDNDTARLVIQTSRTFAEQGIARSILVTLQTSNGNGGPASLAPGVTLSAKVVDTRQGTAISGIDYLTFAPQIVSFGPNSRHGLRRSVKFTPIQDALVEGNETVKLRLQQLNDSLDGQAQLDNAGNITTIDDNDFARLVIQSRRTIREQDGAQSIFVTLRTSNGNGGPGTLAPGVTLTAKVVDVRSGTAKNHTDYRTFGGQTVSFGSRSRNAAQRSVRLVPVNDSLIEGYETVKLRLQQLNKTLDGQASFGNTINITTINDNDTARLVIQPRSTVIEQAGAQPILVTLFTSNGNGGTATLAPGITLTAKVVDTKSGTARVGADYKTFVTQIVVFGPGSGDRARRSVFLTTKKDGLVEGNETVKLRLQQLNDSLDGQAYLVANGNTTTIRDSTVAAN